MVGARGRRKGLGLDSEKGGVEVGKNHPGNYEFGRAATSERCPSLSFVADVSGQGTILCMSDNNITIYKYVPVLVLCPNHRVGSTLDMSCDMPVEF